MCDFEDTDVIAKYPLGQAIDDGVLTVVMTYKGNPVVATNRIVDDFGLDELLNIWQEFVFWKKETEPKLPEEERLFHTFRKKKKVWVIEDGQAYTIMYPDEY